MADAVAMSAAPSLTFSGLASGIDYSSIIDALIKVESTNINRMKSWQSGWDTKVEELQNYNSKLSTFQSSVSLLDSFEEFYSRTSLSSNEDVATVTNNSLAEPGSYNLTVGSNIKHKLASEGFSSEADTVYNTTTGTDPAMVITVGSNTLTITKADAANYDTVSGDGNGSLSLNELSGLINSYSSTVTASILNDSSSSNPYRLVLTATSGGSGNTISVSTNNTSTNFSTATIDSVENIVGTSGSNITSAGTYSGTTNKSINFEIIQGGNITSGDTIKIKWTDEELDKSGVIETNVAGIFDVEQGVQITVAAAAYTEGDKFKIDIFHPNLQKAQDSGLAQTEKELHSGVASKDTEINSSGSSKIFAYKYAGGETIEVNVSDNSTIQDLADAINEDSKNPGVIATIVNDGLGLSNSYHLVLTGRDTGAAYSIEIDDTVTTLDGTGGTTNFTSSTFSNTQEAQNSMIRLDGYPVSTDSYIQHKDNTINDLINGVTITLKSTGNTTIVVANDTTAMKEKIQNFVTSYNEFIKYAEEVTKYDSQTKEAGTLQSNYAAQMVEYDIMRLTTQIATGFKSINSIESPAGSERYISLADIGIKTIDDKYLEIDDSILDSALQDYTDDVALLFGADVVGKNDTTTNKVTYDSYVKNLTEPGTYDVTVTVSGGSITSATINGNTAQINGNYIIGESGNPESGLQLLVDTTSDGTYTAEIRLLRGVTKSLNEKIDVLTDSESGPLNLLIDNYNGIISNIDDKIAHEEDRLYTVEKRLRTQFSLMEEMIAELNGQAQFLSSGIAKIPQIS